MNKSTQNLLLLGAVGFAVYYFMKNGAPGAPGSAPTISETDASLNATAAAIADALPIGG